MPEIKPADLTLYDLIALGTDAVNDRLPQRLLIEAARAYIARESAQRRRQEARRAEQRARGDHNDILDRRATQASAEASLGMMVDWSDLLDVKLQAGEVGLTWGRATVEDHEAAAESLERSGAGFIRTAAMHRRAMADLASSGTRNLIESTMGLR